MTDEERLSAINETIKNLKDDKKGLSSLRNSILGALSPEELQKLKTIKDTKPYAEERFNLFVARKIQEYEKNGKKSAVTSCLLRTCIGRRILHSQ